LVRFRLKPDTSNSHEFELHRPSNKGTKLLLKVLKTIIIMYGFIGMDFYIQNFIYFDMSQNYTHSCQCPSQSWILCQYTITLFASKTCRRLGYYSPILTVTPTLPHSFPPVI